MVIYGYRISGTTDLPQIEDKLKTIYKRMCTIREKEYHKLLGKEIAEVCDQISLQQIQRDPSQTIFDIAVQNLTNRIRNAQYLSLDNEYNLQAFLQVMTLDNDTYLKAITPNEALRKAYKTLEEYSLSEEECKDENNRKYQIWQELHGIYEKVPPLTINLGDDIEPDKDKVTYPSVGERSREIARHNVTSHYLNQMSGGGQIPPNMLMEYMDYALDMTMSDEGRGEIENQTVQLKQILIDLETDDSVVHSLPGEQDETSDKDQPEQGQEEQVPPAEITEIETTEGTETIMNEKTEDLHEDVKSDMEG